MRIRNGSAVAAALAAALTVACGGAPPPVATNQPPPANVATKNAPVTSDRPLNDVKLKNADGTTFSIDEVQGKAKIVNVWATWCAPCIKEMPLLNETAAKFKDKGVAFVAIAVDEEGPSKVQPFLAKGTVKIDGRVAFAAIEDLAPFDVVFPIPDTLVLDGSNRVVKHFDKIVEKDELEAAITEALGAAK